MQHQFLTPWYGCFFFKLYKNAIVVVLLLRFFFFFLMATNALATSWVTFLKIRIIVCFSNFFIWFSHVSLVEINSAHVYFRSRMMLCFDDEKQKDKNIFEDKSQSKYFMINAIAYYYSSFVLFLKRCTHNVSSVVIFHIEIE